MSDGGREYIQARIDVWRKQYQAISAAILPHVLDNEPAPRHLTNELSRLSWLIQKGKERLRMTRTMYDSNTPNAIPDDAQIVAYYPHAWDGLHGRFGHALQVCIDNRGDHADDCHALDVENGAASVQTAVQWVQSWHKLHPGGLAAVNGWFDKPMVYANENTWAELYKVLPAGLYYAWVAQWGTGPTVLHDSVAHQYINHGPNGENYDISVIYDDALGIAPAPAPAPAPPPRPAAQPTIVGTMVWTDNDWILRGRLLSSNDGGHTWW